MRPLLFILLAFAWEAYSLDFPSFRLGEDPAREEYKKGLTYKNLRQYGNAKDKFQRALTLKRDFAMARLELSNTLALNGEWELALGELSTLSSEFKNDLLIQNKIEVLRLGIAGGNNPLERTYFKSIGGDDFRHYRFRNPTDIAFDDEGSFYIASFDTANVIKFNPGGKPIANWKGSFTKPFLKPVGIRFHKGIFYVLDFSRDEVFLINKQGKVLSTIGSSGGANGEFRGPTAIAFDNEDNFYVTDAGNNRIQKFNPKGEFLYAWGNNGKETLRNPSGIDFSGEQIYVVDKDQSRIVIYDLEGNLKSILKKNEWKKPRSIKIIEDKIYVTDELTGIWSYALDLGDWNRFPNFRDKKGIYRVLDRPFAVGIDDTGAFYAVDYARHRIDMFTFKNNLSSNLDLRIESIDTSDFPNIHIFTRLKYRTGQDVLGADRLSFRIYENQNMTPLFSLLPKDKLNEKMNVSFVFENSIHVKKQLANIEDALIPYFKQVNEWDSAKLTRAGKDSTVLLNETKSMRDFLAKIRDSNPEEKWNLSKAGFESLVGLSKNLGPKALVFIVSDASEKQIFYQFSKARLAQYAETHGIPIYVLAVSTNDALERYWKDLTQPTGGKYIFLDGSNSERELYSWIRSSKDNRYILSYKSETNPELVDRFIPISVEVEHRGVKGKDEGGYFVAVPE